MPLEKREDGKKAAEAESQKDNEIF